MESGSTFYKSKNMKCVVLHISREVKKKMAVIAAHSDISPQEVVRDILSDYLKKPSKYKIQRVPGGVKFSAYIPEPQHKKLKIRGPQESLKVQPLLSSIVTFYCTQITKVK